MAVRGADRVQEEAHLRAILGILCWDRDDVTRTDAEAKVRKDSAGLGDLTEMLSGSELQHPLPVYPRCWAPSPGDSVPLHRKEK